MTRTSIFDLYKQNNSVDRDFQRIYDLLDSDHGVVVSSDHTKTASIKAAANVQFRKWKSCGRCIDLNDFLATINYENIIVAAPDNEDVYILFLEVAYNIWHLANVFVSRKDTAFILGSDGKLIKTLLDDILSDMNQKAYYDPETEQWLIGEDSPQITAAVEATEPETASQILHYNHRQLAGKISEKKGILQNLAKYLEGRESELKPINMQLFTDLNTAFNNLDIRHNNIVQRDSSDYKEKLAQMTSEELEKWYDDVYQLILLAILEMDNVERRKRLRTLIQDINQK